jgi:hypothetical protein
MNNLRRIVMRKNVTQLEVEVEGKRFLFICDSDSPLSLVKGVLMDFLNHCEGIEKQILDEMKTKADNTDIEEIEECLTLKD